LTRPDRRGRRGRPQQVVLPSTPHAILEADLPAPAGKSGRPDLRMALGSTAAWCSSPHASVPFSPATNEPFSTGVDPERQESWEKTVQLKREVSEGLRAPAALASEPPFPCRRPAAGEYWSAARAPGS